VESGSLILETGEFFKGLLLNKKTQAGELVFNTSHSGYEEIATDPSYYNQMMVMAAPLQGNYSSKRRNWQSDKIWIKAFICLEIQKSERDKKWLKTLEEHKIPVLSHVDTRQLVFYLRKYGSLYGAVVPSGDQTKALDLIKKAKEIRDQDWTQFVCVKEVKTLEGKKKKGLNLALIDFGFKKNILKELLKRVSSLQIFPSNSSFEMVKKFNPSAIVLSNGPGDPKNVLKGTKLVKRLLGRYPIFGICMGHQILARALGANTYKLKFGHRGSNHPIQDALLNRIYMSAQNHGYAVNPESLTKEVQVSQINLNDKTVAGIFSKKYKCLSVQFHPENGPGPTEALALFDYFFENLVKGK